MKSCRLILKLGMEGEEIVLLLTADVHTASQRQVPEPGFAKDIRQRESKHWAASGVFLMQNKLFG